MWSAIREYTHGGWIPPQLPSASWCSTIHRTSRPRAPARPGFHGSVSYNRRSESSHPRGPDPGTRVRRGSVPRSTSSARSTPSGRTGLRDSTMVRGAIVPRAQQEKS